MVAKKTASASARQRIIRQRARPANWVLQSASSVEAYGQNTSAERRIWQGAKTQSTGNADMTQLLEYAADSRTRRLKQKSLDRNPPRHGKIVVVSYVIDTASLNNNAESTWKGASIHA